MENRLLMDPARQGKMNIAQRLASGFIFSATLHNTYTVIPAKAGISGHKRMSLRHKTPAFAGVTRKMATVCRVVCFCALLAGVLASFQCRALADAADKFFKSPPKAEEKSLAKTRIGILGRDDRRLLPRALAPLQDRVGLLITRRYDKVRKRWHMSTCTASCVSRHVLLTAAHCIMPTRNSKSRGPVDFSRMVFLLRPWAGRHSIKLLPRGDTAKERKALIRTGPGWRKGMVSHSLEDWALIPLSDMTPCPATLRVHPVRADDPRIRKKRHALLVVGFQGDKLRHKDRRLYGSVCRATRAARYASRVRRLEQNLGHKLILHFCDLTKGSSGGPVFAKIRGRPVIIGVVSSTIRVHEGKRGGLFGKGGMSRQTERINVATPATVFYRPLKDMIRKYDGQ